MACADSSLLSCVETGMFRRSALNCPQFALVPLRLPVIAFDGFAAPYLHATDSKPGAT